MKKIRIIIFGWYLCVLLFPLVSICSAEEKSFITPRLLFSIPSEKFRLDKPLRRPGGAASYKGDIYIADSFNNRIIAFNELGELLFITGEKGRDSGQFLAPTKITVDENNLFIIDGTNCRIQVIDRLSGDFKYLMDYNNKGEEIVQDEKGKQIIKKDTLKPIDFELDTKEKLYIVFQRLNAIKVFDKQGNFKFQFGKQGSGTGEFAFPSAVAVNNYSSEVGTKIYVVDTMNYRVQAFNEKGEFLFKFGKHSDEPDGFLIPTDISIDTEGRSYVYDRGKGSCLIFDKDGKFLGQFGKEERIAFAESIFIDSKNNIYIADTLNHRVLVFGY